MGHWSKLGSFDKIGFLDQKPKFWAQKKALTFGDSPCSGHDRKKLFKEKKCLCPNNQGGKCHFGWFFGVKPIFKPKTTFWPNVKTPVSPFFRHVPGPLSFWVIFLMVRTVSPEFRWNRSKIRGSCTSVVSLAQNGQKQGWAPKNDP